MEASVNARLYKGRILLSTEPTDTPRVKALKTLGIPTSAPAWLNVAEIDALLKMLSEARRVVRMHKEDIRKVAHCRECQKYFASCPKHKALFKKYGKADRSRVLLSG